MKTETKTFKIPGGWESAEQLCEHEAGMHYFLSRNFEINNGMRDKIIKDIADRSGQHGYMIFSDGSLFYWNNGDDEVWADLSDFMAEHHENWEESSDGEELLDSEKFDHLYSADQALLIYHFGDRARAEIALGFIEE